MQDNMIYDAGLYLRLSQEDDQRGESVSISTQRLILTEYCQKEGYRIYNIYIDDGYSGMNFDRPGFREMIGDIEHGKINMVITKDLSRLGRDYIMTGYYSEIYFQSMGVRYIAIADNFDSLKGGNDIAPFKNILNDMYARDISNKIKNAKRARARQGLFIGSQTPYGYQMNSTNQKRLIIDPEPAETVRTIFMLAAKGMGNISIAKELKSRKIITPSAYKAKHGQKRFVTYPSVVSGDLYDWSYGTIGQILNNRVYLGELTTLKTEVANCKTKQRIVVPPERQVVTPNAHEPIISLELFEKVREVRASHICPTERKRFNLFRDKLYCECCGHPLTISKKQLKDREADIYFCMYHYTHPEICPKTHRVYHEMLYPYVLQQVQSFAKSMKRRKVNSQLTGYAEIEELTPEILDNVIDRIEIAHVKHKSKPGSVIHIYWKLK